ncbi:CHAT domain-containing protein [Nodosilinea sp. LEGE 07088]|uniref:CHAT domain-containing protein n=1 Tax=Nodosilinea sp. LEGE 07088 TaxID=2777968 RepID=UPI00187F8F23|nr:CHAT domain-containing protein [Nodosilinea sp. LEGE 07088]MBE9139362.1 CHAT domain-containing protein [Nodosilinea sp. LEGE 07088]
MTQEFQISITPVEAHTYWLRTEAVATGVPLAETRVTWPLDSWLAQSQALFQDPLQALLHTPDTASLADSAHPDIPWVHLGQALYEGIFQGRIRDSWVAAQSVAQNRRQPLRLRLGFKDSRLQRLPWELLYSDDRPLSTGLDVTLCRYYQNPTISDIVTLPPLNPASVPLRVLVVISAPNDQERLALRQEVQKLKNSLQITSSSPLTLDLTILEQPGRPELVQALEQGAFQALHYAGHSDAGDTGGDLFLVNRQTGLTDRLNGEDLAGLLVNNGIRLAVFNSCRGAYTPQDDDQAGWRDQNLVQALVNRGVPGVIAMSDRIPDDVALTFTQLLYRNLHQGHPIDLCLSRVRQGLMSAYGSDQPFWMMPLLYLRPDFDGYLYSGEHAPHDSLGDLNGLEVDDLSEATLMLPDYSTDPDIADLAAAMLTRQATDLSHESTTSPLYGWLQEGNQPEADPVVANLVKQLSQPSPPGHEGPLTADPDETLLPVEAAPLGLPSLPQPPPDHQTAATVTPSNLQSQRRWPIPAQFMVWCGLGVAGLGAVLGLTLATRSIANRPVPPDAVVPATVSEAASSPSAPSSALLPSALSALALDRTATARSLVEQMLDRHDLTTAAAVVASLDQSQLLDPDMAYVRGRLAWQQMVTGSEADTSAADAMRAWLDATENRPDFLDAWIALGFAHYAQGNYGQAIQAWERAIAIDQKQQRDLDPTTGPRVDNPMLANAYAGLAMAYQNEVNITLRPAEQAPFQQQAQGYYRQVLDLNSMMINPNALGRHWLWSPALIAEWQVTLEQLAIDGSVALPEGNN